MTSRLLSVLEQIKSVPQDDALIRSLKRRLALQSLRAQFVLSPQRLREMAVYMVHEMHAGLQPNNASTLAMLPSFVYQKNANKFSGPVFAVDLGGTNFRVIRMVLDRGQVTTVASQKYEIPKEHVEGGTADGLFGCIAARVDEFLKRFPAAPAGASYVLGFTFSFPVEQQAIDAGILLRWTKNFTTSGVVGQEVVGLLQKQLQARGVPIRVVALCNDTVGTLVTRYFGDDMAEVGCILGTGANACYWEARSNIKKLGPSDPNSSVAASRVSFDDEQMVVNMEFGNFDSARLLVLPVTGADKELDDDCPEDQRGKQRFEKMISGKYLGEIARRLLVKCSVAGFLPPVVAAKLDTPYKFTARDAGLITADRNPGAPLAHSVLLETYGCDVPKGEDLHFIQQVCGLVQRRSAQLAGMAIAAVLMKTGKQDNASVAVDGSVYSRTPGYPRHMSDAIAAVLGDGRGVRVHFTSDGSGLGAGFIAALTQLK